jgi:hypothetical protein
MRDMKPIFIGLAIVLGLLLIVLVDFVFVLHTPGASPT